MGFATGSDHPLSEDLIAKTERVLALDLGSRFVPYGGVIFRGKRSRQLIRLRCRNCKNSKILDVSNLLSGKSTNCPCDRRTKYRDIPKSIRDTLGERYDAIYQRCNPANANMHPDYAGRGIELRMLREEFIRYFYDRYSERDILEKQIDRIDNNGHYEVGNIRLVLPYQNINNRRNTRFVTYKGQSVPVSELYAMIKSDFLDFAYTKAWTCKLAYRELSGEEIIMRDRLRRVRKRVRPLSN